MLLQRGWRRQLWRRDVVRLGRVMEGVAKNYKASQRK